MPSENALADLLGFVSDEYKREWDKKTSLEQRAITVLTSSGVFVTLVFAFGTAVAKHHSIGNFTTWEKALLGASLALFVVCGAFCLLTNRPIQLAQLPVDFFLPASGRSDDIVGPEISSKHVPPDYPGHDFEFLRLRLERGIRQIPDNVRIVTDPRNISLALTALEYMRVGNDDKANLVTTAISFQLLAIMLLAITTIVVVV